MALLRCDFFSEVLGLSTSMTVILPQSTEAQIGLHGVSGAAAPPVLYLLHGLSDDDTIWTRRTSIERYVAPLGIAVVMPQVHKSFYTDEATGLPFGTFLSQELPSIVQQFFRVSSRPEDTFVAGLSMGGYGALTWAFREPWRFAAVASLSGAVMISNTGHDNDPTFAALMTRVFGTTPIPGTMHDLTHLIDLCDPSTIPPVYLSCGTDDFLFRANEHVLGVARERGIDVTVDFGPGDHEWGYWDDQIQKVLAWLPLAR
jgi:putative tributyrin esterase